MTARTLRDLAREHAKGNLTREAYRKARSELVEGILSGRIPVKDIEFRAPVEPSDPDDSTDATVPRGHKKKTGMSPDPAAASQTAIAPRKVETAKPPKGTPESGPRDRKLPWVVGAAVVLLVVAGALFAVFSYQNSPAPVPAGNGSEATPPPENAATRLISDFLGHEDWSSVGMDKFLARWSALPAQIRATAAGSVAQGRLDTEIYKQLLEERALSGLGDAGKALARQQRLVDFAHQVGIDDPRLVAQPPASSSGAGTPSGTPDKP